jgi:hypothetical protein
MTKLIGIHGSCSYKDKFVSTMFGKASVWNVNETDSLRYLNSGSCEDFINWILTESERLPDNKIIVMDELVPGSVDSAEMEVYYVNITSQDGGNQCSDYYDCTINVNNEIELDTKINILLR